MRRRTEARPKNLSITHIGPTSEGEALTPPHPSLWRRDATLADAERIAQLHTDSWQRTYRGMMRDAFLDGGALDNRRMVWHERLGTARPDQYVRLAEDGS